MKDKKYLIILLIIYFVFSLNNARLSYKAEPFYYGRLSGIVELGFEVFIPLFAFFVGYALYKYIKNKVMEKRSVNS